MVFISENSIEIFKYKLLKYMFFIWLNKEILSIFAKKFYFRFLYFYAIKQEKINVTLHRFLIFKYPF